MLVKLQKVFNLFLKKKKLLVYPTLRIQKIIKNSVLHKNRQLGKFIIKLFSFLLLFCVFLYIFDIFLFFNIIKYFIFNIIGIFENYFIYFFKKMNNFNYFIYFIENIFYITTSNNSPILFSKMLSVFHKSNNNIFSFFIFNINSIILDIVYVENNNLIFENLRIIIFILFFILIFSFFLYKLKKNILFLFFFITILLFFINIYYFYFFSFFFKLLDFNLDFQIIESFKNKNLYIDSNYFLNSGSLKGLEKFSDISSP